MRDIVYCRDLKIKDGVVHWRAGEAPIERGVIYKTGPRITSVVTGGNDDGTVYKRCGGLGTPEQAYQALELWRERGWSGAPSSPASFFRKLMQEERPYRVPRDANRLLKKYFRGGWIELRQKGAVEGVYHHYDLNSAYLWACFEGLPSRVRPYERGDDRYLVLMRSPSSASYRLPRWLRRPTVLVTHRDVAKWGLRGKRLEGVSWDRRDVNLYEYLYDLTDLPAPAFKRLTQSYWGAFAQTRPIRCCSFEDGNIKKEWSLPSPILNLPWAQLIVNRVADRLAGCWQNGAIQTYVDSVIVPYRLRVGDDMGDWKHVKTFEEGVYFRAPGVYDELPIARRRKMEHWYRHAGIPGA